MSNLSENQNRFCTKTTHAVSRTSKMLRKLAVETRPCQSDAARRRKTHILNSTNTSAAVTCQNMCKTAGTTKFERLHISGHRQSGELIPKSTHRYAFRVPVRFTEFCNSQMLIAQFAAPFIVVRTETSIAESCKKRGRNTNESKRKGTPKGNQKEKQTSTW